MSANYEDRPRGGGGYEADAAGLTNYPAAK